MKFFLVIDFATAIILLGIVAGAPIPVDNNPAKAPSSSQPLPDSSQFPDSSLAGALGRHPTRANTHAGSGPAGAPPTAGDTSRPPTNRANTYPLTRLPGQPGQSGQPVQSGQSGQPGQTWWPSAPFAGSSLAGAVPIYRQYPGDPTPRIGPKTSESHIPPPPTLRDTAKRFAGIKEIEEFEEITPIYSAMLDTPLLVEPKNTGKAPEK